MIAGRTELEGGGHVDDGRLIAYRQGAPEGRQEIEAHLTTCAECRALLVELAQPVPPKLRAWARRATLASRPNRLRALVPALAAAAALLLLLSPGPGWLGRILGGDGPAYTLLGPRGSVQQVRGVGAGSGWFTPESQLEWIVRPEAVGRGAELVVYVEAGGRLQRASGGAVERGDGGAIRYEIGGGTLLGAQFGERRVHLVLVSRADAAPPVAATRRELEAALSPAAWFESRVDYRPEETGGAP